MKKIFTFLLITFFLVTPIGTLYAELSIGAVVDMEIIPFQYILNEDANEVRMPGAPDQEDAIMGAGAGRYGSGQGPRVRLDVRASQDDVIGMRARIQARTDGIGIEDYLQAWWKPLPWLRFDAGRFLDDRLRGRINDLDERGNANNVRMYDGDAIFTRFKTHRSFGQGGFMISTTLPENLFIGAMIYDLSPFSASSSSTTAAALFDAHPDYVSDNANAFRRIQAAVGYTVENIGLFRVQYVGAKPMVEITRVSDEFFDDNEQIFYSYMFDTFAITAPRIEAAFAFTGISGLTIDIGGKFPLPFKDWDKGPDNIFEKEDEALLDAIYKYYKKGVIWQAPYQASLGLQFTPNGLDALEIAGRVDAKFLGYMKGHAEEIYFAPEINIHLWPSWDFSGCRFILDVGFEYIGATYNKNEELVGKGSPAALNGGYRLGAGFSVQKNFTKSSLVKGGVACKFPGTVNGIKEKMVITVPLYLEYTF
ncbi:MAG: hypothetical protein LBB72_03055 [Spirochaetaceae bacterium]|nr:hypothetical protein [Spirochaetaceae bacterium]